MHMHCFFKVQSHWERLMDAMLNLYFIYLCFSWWEHHELCSYRAAKWWSITILQIVGGKLLTTWTWVHCLKRLILQMLLIVVFYLRFYTSVLLLILKNVQFLTHKTVSNKSMTCFALFSNVLAVEKNLCFDLIPNIH